VASQSPVQEVRRRATTSPKAVDGEDDLEKECGGLQSLVSRQAVSWNQVELAAEQLLTAVGCGDDSNRKLAELHLQKLVSNGKQHSMRTCDTFGRVIDKVMTRTRSQKVELKETKATNAAELFSEQRLAEAKAELAKQATENRAQREEIEIQRSQLEKEKVAMSDALNFVRTECDRKVAEQKDDNIKMREECERKLKEEREGACTQLAEVKRECQAQLAEGQREMAEKTGKFFEKCGRTVEENKAEMERQIERERKNSIASREECDRIESEKAELARKMATIRAESDKKVADVELEVQRTIQRLRADCERKVLEEKLASDKLLAEGRSQIEEQLRTERKVTDRIMHVLRELPPLQAAMELGDLGLLEQELRKWRSAELPERFGECRGVVEAVLKLAEERVLIWRGVDRTWKEILKETERLPNTVSALRHQSQRIFRVLKESQLTKMDLRRSDRKAMERVCELLLAWQELAMSHSNIVQRLIVRKVAMWPALGLFDFADLDICLRLVDRKEQGSEAFLSRARALVEDENRAPHELRPLLTHLEAMLFYLKYTSSEDLTLAHAEFRKHAKDLSPEVLEYLNWAERMYPKGSELVSLSPGMDLMDEKNVSNVLGELRKSPSFWKRDSLGPFREIFYQWAAAMHSTFNLLVLPHHTQVICLLAFQRFLESAGGPHTLIAQVGTGEGKSMIIATLAIYVAVMLRMKVHVVIDDETLLERDFAAFKRVFDAFEVEVPGAKSAGSMRPLTASMCMSEERVAGLNKTEPHIATRVDPNADIVYCEAKHVQSFYASIARGQDPDFDTYKSRVLILDEVDALVVDEEPNDVFVYPNDELSQLATSVAEHLGRGMSPEEISGKIVPKSLHPAAARVVGEMSKEWNQAKKMVSGKDFAFVKEANRYAAVQAGRTNLKAWSLALECRNFQDGLCKDILFQERLFVTSRPRVFKKYHRVMGLSGSIGNKPEQAFLKDTYRAASLTVPPFLQTCKGTPFHLASPVRLGQDQRIVYLEQTSEAQAARLAAIALDARERVPVLIITRDRQTADQLVETLRKAGRSRGLGALSEDVVRSLSRSLYESDPEQWKENLNRSTLPLGDGHERSWRVTVTDPRGGRGTDYRVDDTNVDAEGGLLLIPTIVPTSRRDWTQFLGRTARQDCRGQFCCVLSSADYEALSKKYKEQLQSDGSLSVVEQILNWGDRESAERIRSSGALFNTGLRMNELCEFVFAKRRDIFKDRIARESLVDACQRLRWMSVREVCEAFNRLPNFNTAAIATEATDMGRPAEPPAGTGKTGKLQSVLNGKSSAPPRVVMFCLDWSASMMSRDTGTRLTRFETCVTCVQKILHEQLGNRDHVGIVGFGPNVQVVAPPTQKAQGGTMLSSRLTQLRPQTAGGTRFFDAVEHCLQLLKQSGAGQAETAQSEKWLVCLTDGDDAGSQQRNSQGELVTQSLASSMPTDMNLLVITVGAMKASNIQIISGWTERVNAAGGLGRLLAEKDAATIARAFEVVAELLCAEVGGAVEC